MLELDELNARWVKEVKSATDADIYIYGSVIDRLEKAAAGHFGKETLLKNIERLKKDHDRSTLLMIRLLDEFK